MNQDQTPHIVAEAVRHVQNLSAQANLSDVERAFVNEQADAVSEFILHRWAAARYQQRKSLRPCCVGLTLGLAMNVAHRTSVQGEALLDGKT